MTRKDYQLIADAIGRSRMAVSIDRNQNRRAAKLLGVSLVMTDLAATLAHDNPAFRRDLFLKACGYGARSMKASD